MLFLDLLLKVPSFDSIFFQLGAPIMVNNSEIFMQLVQVTQIAGFLMK